jgi:hypothetical protein
VLSVPIELALQKPPPPLKREIVTGEIIGWRAWRVKPSWFSSATQRDSVRLLSCTLDVEWKPGVPFQAERKPTDYDASGFSPGVHAWKSFKQALSYSDPTAACGESRIIGEVELWGEVVEHEDGYRAEFAQIKSIYNNGALADRLRRVYGVPKS